MIKVYSKKIRVVRSPHGIHMRMPSPNAEISLAILRAPGTDSMPIPLFS